MPSAMRVDVRTAALALWLVAGCAPSISLPDAAVEDAGLATDAGARPMDAGPLDAGDDDPDPDFDADLPPLEDAGPPPPEEDAGPPDPPDPPDPPTGPAIRTWRVVHWNVAGGKIHRGRTDTGMIRELMEAIRGHDAHFVSLNELCRSQFDEIARRLRADGWPNDPDRFARFVVSKRNGTPGGCGPIGNGLFSRPAIRAAQRFELPHDGTANRRFLMCAALVSLPHMRFCTTHLSYIRRDGWNLRQVRTVFRQLEDYRDAGDTVIVAGDFNNLPDSNPFDAVYSSAVNTPNNRGNTGRYRELDDDDGAHCRGWGEHTGLRSSGFACGQGPKLDYIFAREDRIVDGVYSADARPLNHMCPGRDNDLCADHRMLTGRVRVRIRRD